MPNVSIDSLDNKGTVLTLSHWSSNATPARWKADLSTESVFKDIEASSGRLPCREDLDLAIFRLGCIDAPLQETLPTTMRYCGLSSVPFHNRIRRSTLAQVTDRRCEVRQRYESWVERVTERPRPGRYLSIFADTLNRCEASGGRWVYDGVEQIMPALKLIGAEAGTIPSASFLTQLIEFVKLTPPAWIP